MHATKNQAQKVRLALRDDAIIPGVNGCLVGHMELLQDFANESCELIHQAMAAGDCL